MIESKYINFFKDVENQILLNNNEFTQLYRKFQAMFYYMDVKILTCILYDCNIQVLDLTDSIPDHFLHGAIHPEKYRNIIMGENFYIREGINNIGYAAFRHCRGIKRFYLPSTLKTIEGYGLCAIDAEEIHYNGTKADWLKNVTLATDWINKSKIKKLIFIDSEVIL